MPRDARILSVGNQEGRIRLWFVNQDIDDHARELREFAIYGTGHSHQDISGDYVGTVIVGVFVWHVFDLGVRTDSTDPVQPGVGHPAVCTPTAVQG